MTLTALLHTSLFQNSTENCARTSVYSFNTPHCLHTMLRCGHFLRMSYSVVCMLSTRVSCAKRLNGSQCRLGSRLMVAQELYNLIYKIGVQILRGRTILWGFVWDQIRLSAKVNAITKVGVWQRCGSLSNYFGHLLKLRVFPLCKVHWHT